MDGITFGVPIIALPMQLDQPLNARLAVEIGVGVEKGCGEDIRKKARELSERIQSNVEEEISAVVEQRSAEPRTRLQIEAY
ncbi:unnamed protein product [Coffea canephora]|uniref:Uncharacterized protein n=1 Tax=Coffea canephora TaxID=49390 RepID=A0A068TU80_COFCA|nr:unnamed protein product [Coffea canephora]